MTSIDFYFNAEDRLQVACRLAAKAASQNARMVIYAPEGDVASRIDRLLWTWQALSFVPHCAPRDPLAGQTPVIVDWQADDNLLHDEVLLNLRPEQPQYFGRYRRLIEIVSLDDGDRSAARERFRFYRERGYEIRTHDLSQSG